MKPGQHPTTVRSDHPWIAGEPATVEPVANLRAGWDRYVQDSVRRGALVDTDAHQFWRALVEPVAATGELAIAAERAAELLRCSSLGVTLWLLDAPPGERDLAHSDRLREEVLTAILCERGEGSGIDLPSQAVTLMASLETATPDLTRGERAILQELLERLARGHRT